MPHSVPRSSNCRSCCRSRSCSSCHPSRPWWPKHVPERGEDGARGTQPGAMIQTRSPAGTYWVRGRRLRPPRQQLSDQKCRCAGRPRLHAPWPLCDCAVGWGGRQGGGSGRQGPPSCASGQADERERRRINRRGWRAVRHVRCRGGDRGRIPAAARSARWNDSPPTRISGHASRPRAGLQGSHAPPSTCGHAPWG